jgi:hypothetical protein
MPYGGGYSWRKKTVAIYERRLIEFPGRQSLAPNKGMHPYRDTYEISSFRKARERVLPGVRPIPMFSSRVNMKGEQ